MHNLRRFYVPPGWVAGQTVVLGPEETHHLSHVLRLGAGAQVEVFDGKGRGWEAVVQNLAPEGATLRVVRELEPWGESPLQVILAIGLAKGEAMDQVMRTATEMGVRQILPFISERSERLDPERVAKKLWRWQRLAQETLKSCQRFCLPDIALPKNLAAVLAGPEEAKLLFWEEAPGDGLRDCLGREKPASARVLIGPEGGFSAAEVEQARQAGYAVLSLGPRRLKVETAALAALTLVQYAWGDLG